MPTHAHVEPSIFAFRLSPEIFTPEEETELVTFMADNIKYRRCRNKYTGVIDVSDNSFRTFVQEYADKTGHSWHSWKEHYINHRKIFDYKILRIVMERQGGFQDARFYGPRGTEPGAVSHSQPISAQLHQFHHSDPCATATRMPSKYRNINHTIPLATVSLHDERSPLCEKILPEPHLSVVDKLPEDILPASSVQNHHDGPPRRPSPDDSSLPLLTAQETLKLLNVIREGFEKINNDSQLVWMSTKTRDVAPRTAEPSDSDPDPVPSVESLAPGCLHIDDVLVSEAFRSPSPDIRSLGSTLCLEIDTQVDDSNPEVARVEEREAVPVQPPSALAR
ncbi:hypothetical protein D9758_005176 [Tetrapyrgos nigripes]|uniref:Uncharacterized protein n=1 Tax=Tetrapyrgos nigripes TaxID=182062 RepID=A0A8H5LWD4_9AGAR|nr:hypothetical protein D9758_005176 [Tetrapyrgos nigripes]